MRLEKAQVVQMLNNRGDVDEARRAEAELPDVVDTKEHLQLLTSLGVDALRLDGTVDDETGSS